MSSCKQERLEDTALARRVRLRGDAAVSIPADLVDAASLKPTNPQASMVLWKSLQGALEQAFGWRERQQLEEAMRLSLEESEELRQKRAESIARVDRRLATYGIRRVETPAHGDC